MCGYSYEVHVRGWAFNAGIISSSYINPVCWLKLSPNKEKRSFDGAGTNCGGSSTIPKRQNSHKVAARTASAPMLEGLQQVISTIGDLRKFDIGFGSQYSSTFQGHQWPEGFCDQAISTPVRSIRCNRISAIMVPSQFHTNAVWKPIFIEGFVWPDRLYTYIVAPVASPSQLSRSPANSTPALQRNQFSSILYGYQCPEDLRDQVAILIRETAAAGLLVWFTCWKLGHRNSPEIFMIWGMLRDKRRANEGYISAEEQSVLDIDYLENSAHTKVPFFSTQITLPFYSVRIQKKRFLNCSIETLWGCRTIWILDFW